MLPTSAIEVRKEEVPTLHFPAEPVLLKEEHRKELAERIHKALLLGNNEHAKCRILFKDDQDLKFVETTVWQADDTHIRLKAGVLIPIARVIDVVLV